MTSFNDQPDSVIIAQALRMWANWIETGDPVLSFTDAKNSGQSELIKSLNLDQHKMVSRLHDMADRTRK